MRVKWRTWAAGAVGLALVVPSAHAAEEDLQSDLQEMRDMVLRLQDQMAAQEARIEDQDEKLQEAGLENGDGTLSSLSAFLEATDFSGWVAASYTWNTAADGDDNLVGQNQGLFFYPDGNTFALDQAWFTMDKAPSAESRGGFHVDLLYGKHADVLNGVGFSGNDGVEIFTAYASYLAPIGSGVQINVGELATFIGAEVVQQNANWQITRGLVWGLQPVTHTGITAATELGGGFTLAGGLVNGIYSDTSTDIDENKAFTGQLAWGGESVWLAVNSIYGDLAVPGDNDLGIIDVVATLDATENLAFWFNYDYVFDDVPEAHGFALAGRLGITEDTGIALRGEYVVLETSPDRWSITTTLDHALTENLTARAEFRYDDATQGDLFFDAGGGPEDEQFVLLAQLLYEF